MLTVLVIIVIALVMGLLVLVGLLAQNNIASSKEMVRQSTAIGLLQQQLEAIRQSQTTHGETLTKNLQTGQQSLTQHLEKSQEMLNKLHTQIGQLQGASSRMLQLGADVRSLQDILKAPKLRGQLGEQSLERLLGEVLPAGSFEMQYAFASGKVVDALVKMPDYSVPVDAKFPLPSFERMINSETDDEKARQRRSFLSDVKNRIDEIAAGYINPAEGTLDFALMYIPAENVYYETIIKYAEDKTDILKYALDKKVIPVSPNLLYAYLMTIVMGLHGLQIEKQAAQIRENLKKISAGFETFTANWDVLGKHLRNAQNQYDEGQSKLNKFTIQLDQIQTGQDDGESI